MTAQNDRKAEGQVFTEPRAAKGQKRLLTQEDTGEISADGNARIHYSVTQPPELGADFDTAARPKSQGGWQATSYLTHDEYRLARHRAIDLERRGYRLNIFSTIAPPASLGDKDAKRFVQVKLARLGQSLERRGQPQIGITCFEKPIGGYLHAHSLQYVMLQNFDRLELWEDRFDRMRGGDKEAAQVEIHARLAVASDVDYLLKQHRWAGPDREKRRQFYERSEPIVGQRLSFTKFVLALVGNENAKPTSALATPPNIENEQINITPIRLEPREGRGLFGDDLPTAPKATKQRQPPKRPKIAERYGAQEALPLDCAPTVIELLPRLGRTHHAIGEKLGISRQQASNIIAGRFGPSRRVARRVLELARAA